MIKILAVDDMLPNLRLLSRVLKAPDFELTEANGSSAALTFARSAMPDLILLDLRLGEEEMTGYELARRLRELPGGDKTVIVALSGGAVLEDEAASLAAGFDGFIAKPFSVEQLPETVKAYASRRSGASAQ